MKAREVVDRIEDLGGRFVRQRGSHLMYNFTRDGQVIAQTTVPDHGASDLGKGLLSKIQRDMEPAFGKGWLK